MANPNPSPSTRFQPGNGGGGHRKKGARDRITSKFLEELAEDFEAAGKDAIAKVRDTDPGKYLQVVASLVPRELTVRRPMADLDDAAVDDIVERLRAALAPGDGAGAEAPAEPPVVQH